MKKLLSFFFVLCIGMSFVCASNSQKLFDYDSHESVIVRFLCDYQGVTGPSSSYPITASELRLALGRIDESILPEELKSVYMEVSESLAETFQEFFSWSPSFSISPQIFLAGSYTGMEAEGGRNSFFLPYRDEKPSVQAGIGIGFGNNVFLEGELIVKNSPIKDGIFLTSFDWLLNYRNGNWNFMGANSTGFVAEIPYLARGSVGNGWVNIIVGRTPHSLGTGFTGNMLVGDNFDYQELVKLSFHSNLFTYDIMVTHFDEQDSIDSFLTESFSGRQQSRVVHRFDINFFDKVRFAINLGTLYYSDAVFDYRWLMPFMIAHNYYNYKEDMVLTSMDEANNTNSFEIEWMIGKGWKIGGQFILDQFQTFFEDKDSLPSAYGALANVSWTGLADTSLLTLWGEFVYTNPYLYLNEKYNDEEKTDPNYNYDYILGYHRRGWQSSSVAYSGYPLGPDAIVAALGADVIDYANYLEYSFQLRYSVKGAKGIYSPDFSGGYGAMTPTGDHPMHTISLTGDCTWSILEGKMDLFGGAYFAYVWNYGHNPNDCRFIPQGYFGFSWNII